MPYANHPTHQHDSPWNTADAHRLQLYNEFLAQDTSQPTARGLLARAWAWLDGALTQACELPAPSRREEELGRLVAPLRAFLAAAAETEDLDLVQTAVAALCGEHSDTLLPAL